MKSFVIALAVALVAATSVPGDAYARRVGGGGTSGMQRSLPPRATPDAPKPAAPAAQPAGPTAAAAAAPAAAAKRSWLGPIAGLAAGLGIAALMSHLGLGEAFGNILTLLLLAGVAFFAIRFLMRRFGPKTAPSGAGNLQFAGAGAPMAPARFEPQAFRSAGGSAEPIAAPAAAASLPAGFDAEGFERIAKMIFIRLQAANDAGDLNDLRAFTTPEMFAAIKLDLQERGPTAQRTDVVRVDAEVLDVASEADRQIVSVRFHGLIREQLDGVAEPFDEVWHLVKPTDGSREWAIAGIQQAESTPAA
jgi:predicted lipid-binding transport protein (Tim44 family)